jgi:hypothetical protein
MGVKIAMRQLWGKITPIWAKTKPKPGHRTQEHPPTKVAAFKKKVKN